MANQGRTLLVLGGVLALGIGAAIWAMMSDTDSAPEAPPVKAPDAAPAHADPKSAAPAAPRVRKAGTASVFGEIRRTAGKAPIADQDVMLAPERGDAWTVRTDAQGLFRFDNVPHGGPYELSAAAKGCGTIRIPGIALDRNEQRNVGTLFLDPAVRLLVHVKSYSDQPVAGAVVEAFPIPQWVDWDWSKALAQLGQQPISVAKATTDAKGDALFAEMAVGQWTFTAKKDGYAAGGERGVELRSGQEVPPVTIYLATGHRLDGRVLAADRKPVAGALVLAGTTNSAWDFAAAPLRARTKTDAEGRYAFAALDSGDTQLWVGREGAPSPSAVVRIPLVAHYDIVLRGTGVLTGVVTSKDDEKPVEGATVRAASWESSEAESSEAQTDAEGRYTLTLTAGTINQLTVQKEGLVQVKEEVNPGMQRAAVLHEGETVVKSLKMRRGARLTGVVRSAAGPVASAHVMLVHGTPSEGYEQTAVTAGADGRYEFAAVDQGTVMVLASKEGWYLPGGSNEWWEAMQSPDQAKELKLEIPESGEVTKDLELKRGAVVEGTVTGPDGGPLAGVRVSGPEAPESAPTGADGAFRLEGVHPGPEVTFGCAKEGFTQSTHTPMAVAEDTPTTGVALRMVREARVKGTLSSRDGTPLLDARVLLAQGGEGREDPWQDQWRWQTAARVPVRPDGTYDAPMPFAPPGKLLVRAAAADRQDTDAPPVDLVEGRESYQVDVTLGPGTDLEGRVVAKKGGAPLAGAEVSIARQRSQENGMIYYAGGVQHPVWAVTDETGAFRVPHLAPGKYDVRAQAQGFVAGTAQVDLATDKSVSVEMSPEMTIEGVVSFPDGRPVAGVEVQATGGARTATFGGFDEGERSSTTDAKGAFKLRNLPEGSYTVQVSVPWGSDLNVRGKQLPDVAAGRADVKIVVEAGATISGHVVDAKGRRVTSAWISANPSPREGVDDSGNEWRGTQVRSDGTFLLAGLGDGPYNVQVQSQSGTASHRPATVENVVVGTKDLEIVMQEGFAIAGVLVDPDGKPLSQVALQAAPAEPRPGEEEGGNGWTDQQGRFTISGLAPGNYKLTVAPWGGSNQGWVIDGAQTYAAGANGLRIVAGRGVTISGVLVDDTGKPVAGGWINATAKKDTQPRGTQSKEDGTFEVSGLETGAVYTLHGNAQGRVNVALENVAAGSRDVRLVVAKGLACGGRVIDATGKAVANRQIMFTSEDGKHSQWTQTDEEGRFAATGLVDGAHTAQVYLNKEDGSGEWKNLGTVKAGETNADLRMP